VSRAKKQDKAGYLKAQIFWVLAVHFGRQKSFRNGRLQQLGKDEKAVD
jgi:hypothetical protein